MILIVAVLVSAAMSRYGDALPSEMTFTTNSRAGTWTNTYPTQVVVAGVWMLCVLVPLVLWIWLQLTQDSHWWARSVFASIAGLTTSAGIFAATFVAHYGNESFERPKDALLAIGAGITCGVVVRVLGPRRPREDAEHPRPFRFPPPL